MSLGRKGCTELHGTTWGILYGWPGRAASLQAGVVLEMLLHLSNLLLLKGSSNGSCTEQRLIQIGVPRYYTAPSETFYPRERITSQRVKEAKP